MRYTAVTSAGGRTRSAAGPPRAPLPRLPVHGEEEGSERGSPGPAAPRCPAQPEERWSRARRTRGATESIAPAGRAPCAPAPCPPPPSPPRRSAGRRRCRHVASGVGPGQRRSALPAGRGGLCRRVGPRGAEPARAVPSRRGAALPTSLLPPRSRRTRPRPLGGRCPWGARPVGDPAARDPAARPRPAGRARPGHARLGYPARHAARLHHHRHVDRVSTRGCPPPRPSAAPARGLRSPARPAGGPTPGRSGQEGSRVSSLVRGAGCHRCRPSRSDSARAGGRHLGCPELLGRRCGAAGGGPGLSPGEGCPAHCPAARSPVTWHPGRRGASLTRAFS